MKFRFQFSLRLCLGLFLAVSVLLGFAVKFWPYYKAWHDMETYVRGAGADSLVWGQHFKELGAPGCWAMRRALQDNDQKFRANVVEMAGWMRNAGYPLLYDLALIVRNDPDPEIRNEAILSIAAIFRNPSAFLPFHKHIITANAISRAEIDEFVELVRNRPEDEVTYELATRFLKQQR